MKNMTETASDKMAERARRKAEKRDAKKIEIASSTLDTLKRLGYANTTLRDITAESGLPLSSLSYYFIDKAELITFCVRLYKADFIKKLDLSIESTEGRNAVLDKVSNALALSIMEDRATHQLWYDIRCQSMFDSGFSDVVKEIEGRLIETLTKIAKAAGAKDTSHVALGYAMIDGMFRYLMQNADRTGLTQDQAKAYFAAALGKIF